MCLAGGPNGTLTTSGSKGFSQWFVEDRMAAIEDGTEAGQPLPLLYNRSSNTYHTPNSWMEIDGNKTGFWPAGKSETILFILSPPPQAAKEMVAIGRQLIRRHVPCR